MRLSGWMRTLRAERRSRVAGEKALSRGVFLAVGSGRMLVYLLKKLLDFLLVFGRKHAKSRLGFLIKSFKYLTS